MRIRINVSVRHLEFAVDLRNRSVFVAGVTVAAALWGCRGKAPPAAPIPLVLAGEVRHEAGSGEDPLRYPVEVAARYTTTMSFRVAGKVIERRVRLGDTVHQGDVVARLDPIDAQRQAASARASFAAAEHRLGYARRQLDRDQAQSGQNLIAVNQWEQTQDAFAAATAAREQAAAQDTLSRNALKYNTLIADHDGMITSENVDTGQVVTTGQAVYGLAWSGDTDVNLDAAASDLGRLSVGAPATVVFAALPGRRFEARVREISPAADPQSRTYRVKLTLLAAGGEVHLGMTGEATLAPPGSAGILPGGVPSASVFKVPATALFHRGKDPAIWVIRDGDSTLELRPVTVRAYSEQLVTVTQGLKDGERIVLAGVHTVYAGQRVTPTAPLFASDSDAAPALATR